MSIPTLTFFNNKGGVGKTTLVYHLSWMFSELGVKTLVVDCDPQANVTAALLKEDLLSELFAEQSTTSPPFTMFQAVAPLLDGTGDVADIEPLVCGEKLYLLPGDLRLSTIEDELSLQWNQALGEGSNRRAMRVLSAFWRIAQKSAKKIGAELIVFDVGPNLGAINRSVLIGTDGVVVPLAADLFSIQGMRNLGPALAKWRSGWQQRLSVLNANPIAEALPNGNTQAIGYIAMQHQERLSRPIKAYSTWLERMPGEYRSSLSLPALQKNLLVGDDPHCLALLRHYRSLIPLAQEAGKPIFFLRSADGAFGSHMTAVHQAYGDFQKLAEKILGKAGFPTYQDLS